MISLPRFFASSFSSECKAFYFAHFYFIGSGFKTVVNESQIDSPSSMLSSYRSFGKFSTSEVDNKLVSNTGECFHELFFNDEPERLHGIHSFGQIIDFLSDEKISFGGHQDSTVEHLSFMGTQSESNLDFGQNKGVGSKSHLITAYQPNFHLRGFDYHAEDVVVFVLQGERKKEKCPSPVFLVVPLECDDCKMKVTSGNAILRLKVDEDEISFRISYGDEPQVDEWDKLVKNKVRTYPVLTHNLS